MAKFLKRIGTKKIIYEYEILVEKIEIKLSAPCQLAVLMKRGHRKAETQRKINYDPKKGFVMAEEALLMKASLFLNLKNNKYLDKFAHFYVKVLSGKSSKSGGEIKVNLSFYPNNNIKERKEMLSMEKGPDKNCRLFLNIKCNKLGEAQDDDSDSDASEKSQTSRSDISFDKELEEGNSQRVHTQERKGPNLNTSPSKNMLRPVTPPKSPKNLTPRNNEKISESDKYINEKNKSEKMLGMEKKPIIPEKEKEKSHKKIFDSPEKKSNVDSSIAAKSPDINKNASNSSQNLNITKPKQEIKQDLQVKDPKNSNFKNALAMNPNLKPSEKTQVLRFDDEELENEEEEKLPSFGGVNEENRNKTNDFSNKYSNNNAASNYNKPNMNQPSNQIEKENDKTQTQEINKFSFMRKEENNKNILYANDEDEEDDGDEPIIVISNNNNNKNIGNSSKKEDSDDDNNKNEKEMEYLDKILNLEKNLGLKNDQLIELMKKNDDLMKKNEEMKNLAYKNNKDVQMGAKSLQQENDKLKFSLKESEEKRQALTEELRQLSTKYKKLELDYKNVLSDYESLIQEQKQKEENFYDLQGQKETIESTNKSYSLELKNHKDKIAALSAEIVRLRDELKTSADENESLQKNKDDLKFQMESMSKEIEKMRINSQSLSSSNENAYKEVQMRNEALIKELNNKIRIAEGQKEEALSSQTRLALDLQNMKIEREQLKSRLESRIQEINANDQSLREKADYLEKENRSFKAKIMKLQKELDSEKEEQSAYIEKLLEDLKNTKRELMELEKSKKDLETELIAFSGRTSKTGEISESLEGLKQNFDRQINMLRKQLDFKEEKNRKLEKEYQLLEQEVSELQLKLKKQDLVGGNRSSIFENVSDETLKQRNEELELLLLNKEEEFMEKTDSLQKEIDALKLQIVEGTKRFSMGKRGSADDSEEIVALSVENQKLKKTLKELQSKGAGGREDKELENLKRKNKELEIEKQKLADEIINIKMNNANFENNKEINSKALLKYTDQIKTLESTLKAVEMELVKSKEKLGDAINAAMEIGGPKLVDRIVGDLK